MNSSDHENIHIFQIMIYKSTTILTDETLIIKRNFQRNHNQRCQSSSKISCHQQIKEMILNFFSSIEEII